MTKYSMRLKAERKLEAQQAERQMRADYQRIELSKAELATAEERFLAARTTSKRFSPEYRAAGDKFVAAWLRVFGSPASTSRYTVPATDKLQVGTNRKVRATKQA